VINQSEFKSLQQPLYDERNNIVYTWHLSSSMIIEKYI
jgi:hypothetical protein